MKEGRVFRPGEHAGPDRRRQGYGESAEVSTKAEGPASEDTDLTRDSGLWTRYHLSMPEPVQNYKNHAKFVPVFHFVVMPLLLVNLTWAVATAMRSPDAATIIAATTAIALVLLAFLARVFALKVQDRVIRLEMRLRLRELLPAALHPRILEFTAGQMVAMRFASDAELPELAQAVLRDRITDKKAIKLMIKDWTPDHHRT